jgi:hypothetical protein
MEARKQLATMIGNTGVIVLAGTTVAFLLSPERVPPIIAVYGLAVWISCFILVAVISEKGV